MLRGLSRRISALPPSSCKPTGQGGEVLVAKARDNKQSITLSAPVTLTVTPPPLGTGTGLRGDYAIAADRYEPFIAGPSEQGLCAWALAHAAATAAWPADLRGRAAE